MPGVPGCARHIRLVTPEDSQLAHHPHIKHLQQCVSLMCRLATVRSTVQSAPGSWLGSHGSAHDSVSALDAGP